MRDSFHPVFYLLWVDPYCLIFMSVGTWKDTCVDLPPDPQALHLDLGQIYLPFQGLSFLICKMGRCCNSDIHLLRLLWTLSECMCRACHIESAWHREFACVFTSYEDDEFHRFIVGSRQPFNLGLWNVRARKGFSRSSTEESFYRKRKWVPGGLCELLMVPEGSCWQKK